VLTICGTIGISDLLSNLNCDYDNLEWNGKTYSVHKSIYESAKNFTKSSSIPLTVISKALEIHSTYRLILCGHSYGGAVAALLALLWSDPEEPNKTNNTSGIPSNRSIHAYVYGAPSCMSYELSVHCIPLITNIINHNDIIPYFSHGFMKDQKQCCKLIFSYLNNEIPKKRKSFISGILSRAMNKQEEEEEESYEWIDEVLTRSFNTLGKRSETKKQNDDKWFTEIYGKCKKLMNSDKIYPPGYLFIIEETSETYTNPNNVNDKSHSNKKKKEENPLVPAIAIDTETILENETSMFESDQDTITIYNTKKDKNKITKNDGNHSIENENTTNQPSTNKDESNDKNKEGNNNLLLNDESLLSKNMDIDNSNYSFEKFNDSFNDFNKDIDKSFAIEKSSDIFIDSSASDINNHKAILLSTDNNDLKAIFDHQIIHISNSSINQKSENINLDNSQPEKITRIKLYECQVFKI
ncbi:hypothetical protein PIROE2DRAFT_2905, partial [Piromyces sp. E2]